MKSKLTKAEIKSAVDNISSYKSLSSGNGKQGFGIIFAYDSDLEWHEIVKELKALTAPLDKKQWCNLVVILNRGIIIPGDKNHGVTRNFDIEQLGDLVMHGRMDEGNSLFIFYTTALDLCAESITTPAAVNAYFRLPLIAGKYSYEFVIGAHGEVANCDKHGSYQKKISEINLAKIIEVASKSKIIEMFNVFDLAREETPKIIGIHNPVSVYNPDNLSFKDILCISGNAGLSCELIKVGGGVIIIPWYYSKRDRLFGKCPQCKK